MSTVGVWVGLVAGLVNLVVYTFVDGDPALLVSVAFCVACSLVSSIMWLGATLASAIRSTGSRSPTWPLV